MKFDAAFLDPPRSGCDERFLSSLIKMGPEKIVYISCNPETQARDIRYLKNFGSYYVRRIQGVDMFPRTSHVESVALLTKAPENDEAAGRSFAVKGKHRDDRERKYGRKR